MQKTTEQEMQRAIAASDMFQLLAMALYLPTREMAEGLLEGSLAEDVRAIGLELGFAAGAIDELGTGLAVPPGGSPAKDSLLTELRQEYTRLFTHPHKPEIAIYETLFRYNPEEVEGKPSLFISPAALDAERCYKKAGLILTQTVNEPGDHMATELEFMMFLYLQKAKALEKNNEAELRRRNEEIREFSELHIERWAIAFFDRMAAASRHGFYKIFGRIGSTLIAEMPV